MELQMLRRWWLFLAALFAAGACFPSTDEFLKRIKDVPSNKDDIDAVNILHCIQKNTWEAIDAKQSDQLNKYQTQLLITGPIFKGGKGASEALEKVKKHPYFQDEYAKWTSSEKYKNCTASFKKIADEKMPADNATHPCRKRCQCDMIYSYVRDHRVRVGDFHLVSLKNDYLEETWVQTDEYHLDFERYELQKFVYADDMEIVTELYKKCV